MMEKSTILLTFRTKSALVLGFLYTISVYYSMNKFSNHRQKLLPSTTKHKKLQQFIPANTMQKISYSQTIKPHNISKDTLDCDKLENFIKCNKLWNGESLYSFDLPRDMKISLVISYCNEDSFGDHLQKYVSYIIPVISHLFVIMRCKDEQHQSSFLEGLFNESTRIIMIEETSDSTELNFAKWLSDPTDIKQSIFQQENHYIVFLNPKSLTSQYTDRLQPVDQVLRTTIQYGIGCVLGKQILQSHSIFHNTTILKIFQDYDLENTTFLNYGDWFDRDIGDYLLPELIPVCYSSSFAIKATDIVSKHDMLSSLSNSLNKHKNTKEVKRFVERTWGIFSYPLSTNHTKALQNRTRKVLSEICCLTGSLVSNYAKPPSIPLWRAKDVTSIDNKKFHVDIVISYCNSNMSWLRKYLRGFAINSITILSTCNNPVPEIPNIIYPKIVQVQNKTGCDNAFTYYMTNMIKQDDYHDDHIVVFLKARESKLRTFRALDIMVNNAATYGFACGTFHTGHDSYYVDTTKLYQYTSYTKFGIWLDKIDVQLTYPIAPVCYSTNFAVKALRILEQMADLQKIDMKTKNGCYPGENDFVTRVFAGVLSNHLWNYQIEVIRSIATGASPRGSLTADSL